MGTTADRILGEDDSQRDLIDQRIQLVESARMRLRAMNVQEAASLAGMSGSQLSRLPAVEFDVTFVRFRKAMSVWTAVRLLVETEDQVAQIAYQLGYPQPNKLDLDFRLCLGLSPTRVRRILKSVG